MVGVHADDKTVLVPALMLLWDAFGKQHDMTSVENQRELIELTVSFCRVWWWES